MEEGLKYDEGKPAYDLLEWSVFPVMDGTGTGDARQLRSWLERFAAAGDGVDLRGAMAETGRLICTPSPEAALRDEVARVLAFGAKKYARHNWRLGMDWSRLIGAAMRHLAAFTRGELHDPETGLHHLGHLGCCLMFLIVYERDGIGTDDRDPRAAWDESREFQPSKEWPGMQAPKPVKDWPEPEPESPGCP